MGNPIPVFHINTSRKSKTSAEDITGESVKKISSEIKAAVQGKGVGATISGRLSKNAKDSETTGKLYVRSGDKGRSKLLTPRDVLHRQAATLAVEHLLQRFEEQPDAQQFLCNIRKEMRRPGGEIKAKTLQTGLDNLVEIFDATDGDRNQILKLDATAIGQLARDTGIPKKGFSAMRSHVQHRHDLLHGNAAGAPPSLDDVAEFARDVLDHAKTAPDALNPEMRALYFEAKAFGSAYPALVNLQPGMVHTPGLSEGAVFAAAARLLGAVEFDEGKLDDAAQEVAGAIIKLLKGNIRLVTLFATQGGQYRLELSKALMDAVASQGKKADSGRALLEISLADLFQRLDTFSATVFSHVQKVYDACYDGDLLIETSADGDRTIWTRDIGRSAAEGASGTSLYRNGNQTWLVKEIDARPDSGRGAAPIDRQDASLEALRHVEVTQTVPRVALHARIAPSTDGKVRLAMERPEYGNMGQFINSQLGRDERHPEAARALCGKVANVLNQLHQSKMSHGAFGPEDVVMVPGEGNDFVVRLTNFGASHSGTFMYGREDKVVSAQRKSPERLAPKGTRQDPDASSFSPQKDDVWAFGLMVYQMFSPLGSSAFPGAKGDFEVALKTYTENYAGRRIGRGLPQSDKMEKGAREFITWVLNPDPAKRPSMATVLRHEFLAPLPGKDAIELIHESGQLQDFLDWGPSQIRQFSADTGIAEVQIRAMIQYLRTDRDDGPETDMPDVGTVMDFVKSFRDFFAKQTPDTAQAFLIFALQKRVEALAQRRPNLLAKPSANNANTGAPAVPPAADSVKGVLKKFGSIEIKNGATASGVVASKTINGKKGPHLGVRVRNQHRNVLQRLADRLTGAHVARRQAAQRSVEHLVKRFEDQPGAKEILANLRSTIRNPRKTLLVTELTDTLNALVKKFDLDSVGNTALKEFVGREAADVLDFAQATGIPEELVATMQAHLRHRSGLLDGSASAKAPSQKRVADFARRFDLYMREAPTVLTDPAMLALEAEVRAFALSRPDLMDRRAGMVHTPGLTDKIIFATAARLLRQPQELDLKREADAAKQLARLIVRSLQDPQNNGRDLPVLFATSGMEYRRELSDALKNAIAGQGPVPRSGKSQSPLRPDKLAARLAKFSDLVYAEVLNGLPDHCEGDNVVVGNSALPLARVKALGGMGATAKLFVYASGDDTAVVKELISDEDLYGKIASTDRVSDFEEARLHLHINEKAKWVAPKLHAVVQSVEGKVRFVMEHAIFGDLQSFIKTGSGTADEVRNEATFSLCKQVAENLYELHAFANVGHIDFKPANVLLTRGARGAVLAQLTDFGASREGKTMFLRDDPVSSPQWKSPERVPELKVPDARFSTHAADVWAFGVTMYQMYAKGGRNPFDRTLFDADIGPKIRKYEKDYLSTVIPGSTLPFDDDGIPPYVRPLIRFILNPDPALRPTMAEILQHKLMTSARPLSMAASDLIKAAVGADAEDEVEAPNAPGAKSMAPTPRDGMDSDVEISSSDAAPPRPPRVPADGDEESSSLVESTESSSEPGGARRASGSASDSSSEESLVSESDSGPSGTFRANVVQNRPATANEVAMKISADKPQQQVRLNTALNPHQKARRQRPQVKTETFDKPAAKPVKPSGSEDSSDS
jgi:serine/threonine protein kinase